MTTSTDNAALFATRPEQRINELTNEALNELDHALAGLRHARRDRSLLGEDVDLAAVAAGLVERTADRLIGLGW